MQSTVCLFQDFTERKINNRVDYIFLGKWRPPFWTPLSALLHLLQPCLRDSYSFHKPSIHLCSFSPQLYRQSASVSTLSSSGEKKVFREAGNAGKTASTTTALSSSYRDHRLLRSSLKKSFTNVTMDFRELWCPCTNENRKSKTNKQTPKTNNSNREMHPQTTLPQVSKPELNQAVPTVCTALQTWGQSLMGNTSEQQQEQASPGEIGSVLSFPHAHA